MPTGPAGADRLEELAVAWQEARERGRDVPAAELCRDCPELAPELERRLAVLRRFDRLSGSAEAAVETSDGSTPPNPAATQAGLAPPLPADAPPAPPGYEVLAELGRGGMGVVYKARHLKLNRVEAVKMIRSGGFAGPRELARFRFEAEAAAELAHPNIVTLYSVGEADGLPYLAMRFVDGCGLTDRRPATPRETARLLAKVARAVHYAHQRGFLHRDLKPDNILVDAAGEPFVTDFGIARRLGAEANVTNPGAIVGTPQYMSPEQARGVSNLTVASDVYALGAILYFCLTGRPPFTGPTTYTVLKQVVGSPPAAPHAVTTGVDPELEAVCLKCLEKDPADRYPSAQALAEELDRYLRGEGVSARAPGLWDWLRQVWRTSPPPNPNYSWQVPFCFAFLLLAMNGAVFSIVREGLPAAWFWATQLAGLAVMWVVVWVYMARRFRRLPATERHAMMIAVGHLIGYAALAVACVPPSAGGPSRGALDMYPALACVSGLGLFALGTTHWSRFFPIGLAMMALAPVMARWPDYGPLVYGGAASACMFFMAYEKKVTFGARAVKQAGADAESTEAD